MIEDHWYVKINLLLSIILLPLSLVFLIVSRVRYYLFKSKLLKSYKLPVPVVIVGNISVGGAGKTPLTKFLAQELSQKGISVGVILRGYKSKVKDTKVVTANDSSDLVGDESLIYAKNNIRVAIGRNRYLAGLTLLKQYPDIKLILTDDGLQHYRLQRDYEIAVIDSTRMLGNQFVLPMGPLRETCSRLKSVNAVVINGNANPDDLKKLNLPQLVVSQTLIIDKIFNPRTNEVFKISDLNLKNICAIAAIGNPQRFFQFLNQNGFKLSKTLAFPDHHKYIVEDIPMGFDAIIVTEKDYAKLSGFSNTNFIVVEVKSILSSSKLVLQLLGLT